MHRIDLFATLLVAAMGLRIQVPETADVFNDNYLLLVPELKLAFCFIPKVACTQFNRLMNTLNKIPKMGAGCGPDDPNFKSVYTSFGYSSQREILDDPAWTKAVFLRDPLERVVSAYRSKCEAPRECGSYLPCGSNFSMTVKTMVKDSSWKQDQHWRPQEHFCQGLATNIQKFNFVGHLSKDYTQVSNKLIEMLELAKNRNDGVSLTKVKDSMTSEFFQSAVQASFSEQSEQEACDFDFDEDDTVKNAFCKWFPPSGPKRDGHNTFTHTDLMSQYFDQETLKITKQYYEIDYSQLPGLQVPDWARQIG